MDNYISPRMLGAERVFAEALATGPVSAAELIEFITTDVPGAELEYDEIRLAYAMLLARHADLFSGALVNATERAVTHLGALVMGAPDTQEDIVERAILRYRRRAPMQSILNSASTSFSWGTDEEHQEVARRQALLIKALLNGQLPPELEQFKPA